jgi:ubiquinone/menaquinone biosynthesis C-methylase UbiE
MPIDNKEEFFDLTALYDAENYIYFNYDLFLNEEKTGLEIQFLNKHLDFDKTHKILDLACGHGRHAGGISPEVGWIVGVDNNKDFLELAEDNAKKQNLHNVTYIQNDMRKIQFKDEFNRVILLSTAFGFFCDSDNLKVLININHSLKQNGLLCFDIINRDNSLVNFEPHWVVEKDNNYLIDRCTFDPLTGRMLNRRIYIKDGIITHAPFFTRIYNYSEINILLKCAKLQIVKVFADWNGTKFDQSSKKMVIIAKKIEDV